jgi:putative RecB family exonuclease
MEKALAQLREFVNSHDICAQPIMMEEMMDAEISPGLVLRGRIDRVDKLPNGSLHIIDYKTGNMARKIDWEQLELHALILSRRSPLPVSEISYLYLDNSTMKSTVISDGDVPKVHWRFLTTANTIRQEKQFRASPGSWCRDCDFISICPGKSEAEPFILTPAQYELWNDSE